MGNWYEYNFAGKRALLVEDHQVNAWVAQKMLEKVGFEVVLAADGEKGVEEFRRSCGSYDVILMDINMPVMNGLEAAKAIRAMEPEGTLRIPIIAMTTNGYIEDIHDSRNAGMDEHLVKPIEPEVLFRCIERYVKQSD